jgi:hypothetical protein
LRSQRDVLALSEALPSALSARGLLLRLSRLTDISLCVFLAATWTYNGNYAYNFNPTNMTQANAASYCSGIGGHLPSVHSDEQNAYIFSLQPHNNAVKWLGGSRIDKTNPVTATSFVWTDGTSWDYYLWATAEPNNNNGKEYCVQMGHKINSIVDGSWNDAPCSNANYVVCQRNRKFFAVAFLNPLSPLLPASTALSYHARLARVSRRHLHGSIKPIWRHDVLHRKPRKRYLRRHLQHGVHTIRINWLHLPTGWLFHSG